MPVTKTARRALRKSIKQAEFNQKVRRNLKRLIKQNSIATSETDKPSLLTKTVKAIDKAAKRRIIHPNKAARIKSRLAKLTKTHTENPTPVPLRKKSKKTSRRKSKPKSQK
ncbi:hypothetical protein AUJ38_01395 [bacterium CG1_02_42_9]|nr:MAG: hypothetical protein AUJ38_01395 [bacterium CG1_02_42_9]